LAPSLGYRFAWQDFQHHSALAVTFAVLVELPS